MLCKHVSSGVFTLHGNTYVRCLRCGRYQQYDWQRMCRVGGWLKEEATVSAYGQTMTRALNPEPEHEEIRRTAATAA